MERKKNTAFSRQGAILSEMHSGLQSTGPLSVCSYFQEGISFLSSTSVNSRVKTYSVSAATSLTLAAYHFPKVWESDGLISRFTVGQEKTAWLTCLSETI